MGGGGQGLNCHGDRLPPTDRSELFYLTVGLGALLLPKFRFNFYLVVKLFSYLAVKYYFYLAVEFLLYLAEAFTFTRLWVYLQPNFEVLLLTGYGALLLPDWGVFFYLTVDSYFYLTAEFYFYLAAPLNAELGARDWPAWPASVFRKKLRRGLSTASTQQEVKLNSVEECWLCILPCKRYVCTLVKKYAPTL